MSKNRTTPKGGGPARPSSASKAPARPERDETDSFIDEVTEELRRDRAMEMARRYGPFLGGLLVAIIVGAAIWEYMKSVETTAARDAGSALTAAADAEFPSAAFETFARDADAGPALIARLRAADAYQREGDLDAAVRLYEQISNDRSIDAKFSDLAELRAILALFETEDGQALANRLDPLTRSGAPYRPMALELLASAQIKSGDVAEARATLEELLAEQNLAQGVATRASALLDALGGPSDDAPNDADGGDADQDAQ